ncbi:MAG: hypothetical protein LBB23_01670 [Rickettsiales bacterium]|jgi:hypothetical protein|nr:hypothetical protein [Rickettsiales bacterium]
MFEALLILAVVIAFMPTLFGRLANRATDAETTAAAEHMIALYTAASEFVRDNNDKLPDKVISGSALSAFLEPYGLPLGWNPRTPLGQDLKFYVVQGEEPTPLIEAFGGGLSESRRANLAMRLGFWAGLADATGLRGATGDWELPGDFATTSVFMRIPLTAASSDLLARTSANPARNAMQTDLDMQYHDVVGARTLEALRMKFSAAFFGKLHISGADESKATNDIKELTATSATFTGASSGDSALNLSRGELNVGSMSVRSISSYGGQGAELKTGLVSVLDYDQSPGSSSFIGPLKWRVQGSAELSNTALSDLGLITIANFAEITSDANVFSYDDTGTKRSGVFAGILSAAHITLRDQTARVLVGGDTASPTIVSIRPAGTSLLPDMRLQNISNDSIKIISSPEKSNGDTISCRSIIEQLGHKYDANSVSQNIACRYAMYSRLERRIEIKKCLIAGGSQCL